MELFFDGGPLNGTSRAWDGNPPRFFTFAAPASPGGGFQLGHVYEKVMDNRGADLGNGPQTEYRYLGDTSHGEIRAS